MISRIWVCIFSVVLFPNLTAKPVSLNKLIEAEEALPSENTPTVSKPDLIAKSISLNKLIDTEEKRKQVHRQKLIQPKEIQEKTTKLRTGVLASGLNKITKTVSGTVFLQNKNPSPLNYRKAYEIKSPVKPKRVTLFQRTNRLRNQSGKRDTYQYGAINQKYVPLLRNLGVLFDNILGTESSETNYGDDYSNESEERVCTCVSKKTGRESRQKAAASARVGVTETTPPTQATSPPATTPTPSNLSSVGRNQNISLLFTRNTTGVWRNNIRVDERSGPTHLGSAERYISGDSGDDERDPRNGEAETDSEDNEEDTNGHTGDDVGDDRFARRGGNGNKSRGFSGKSIVSHKFKTSPNKTVESLGGHIPEYEGEIQFEIRTDKAKGSRVLSKSDSRLRDAGEEIQATEEKDIGEYSDTSNQQLFVRNGEDTEENQKLRGTYEGMSSLDANTSNHNDKYVMIYDGYSVARDVNGKNTLTEKAITIHS